MLKYASKRKCLFYLNCKVWCYNKADIATDLSLSGRGFLALITFFLFCFYLSQWKCLNLFIIFLVRINKTSMSFVLKTLWSKLKIMKNIVCNFGLYLIGLVWCGNFLARLGTPVDLIERRSFSKVSFGCARDKLLLHFSRTLKPSTHHRIHRAFEMCLFDPKLRL